MWTKERERRLARLWRIGETPSQIARALGGFEREADGGRAEVIRKAQELGVARPRQMPVPCRVIQFPQQATQEN